MARRLPRAPSDDTRMRSRRGSEAAAGAPKRGDGDRATPRWRVQRMAPRRPFTPTNDALRAQRAVVAADGVRHPARGPRNQPVVLPAWWRRGGERGDDELLQAARVPVDACGQDGRLHIHTVRGAPRANVLEWEAHARGEQCAVCNGAQCGTYHPSKFVHRRERPSAD